MIFSRGSFCHYLDRSRNPSSEMENDFTNLMVYKQQGISNNIRKITTKQIELLAKYSKSWKRYNYRTKMNLSSLFYCAPRSNHSKRLFDIPYYQKNQNIIENCIYAGIGYIPEDLMTREYLEIAMENGYYKFQYIPDRLKTREMVRDSIVMDPKNFDFIPDSMLTPDFINRLISYNSRIIDYIPGYMQEEITKYRKH